MTLENSQQIDLLPMELALTQSAAGSLAKTSAQQDAARELLARGQAYGKSTPETRGTQTKR